MSGTSGACTASKEAPSFCSVTGAMRTASDLTKDSHAVAAASSRSVRPFGAVVVIPERFCGDTTTPGPLFQDAFGTVGKSPSPIAADVDGDGLTGGRPFRRSGLVPLYS